MDAYVLEYLYPTGWRRRSELHWRYGDAQRAANFAIKDDSARAVRVLPVRISVDAILSIEAPVDRKGAGE